MPRYIRFSRASAFVDRPQTSPHWYVLLPIYRGSYLLTFLFSQLTRIITIPSQPAQTHKQGSISVLILLHLGAPVPTRSTPQHYLSKATLLDLRWLAAGGDPQFSLHPPLHPTSPLPRSFFAFLLVSSRNAANSANARRLDVQRSRTTNPRGTTRSPLVSTRLRQGESAKSNASTCPA